VSNEDQTTSELDQEAVEAEQEQAQVEGDEQQAAPEAEEKDELTVLKEQVEALTQELADTKDNALRTVADAQNSKRRAEKDVENARKYALEKFASEMLGIVDNLERAVDAADKDDETVKPLLEGVELTHKSLIDGLKKFNVEQLDPVGEPFDPQFHQAMSMVENPDVEPNTITLVMQKGYSLNGRLLRPAMVMVAKAPTSTIDEKA